MARKSIPTGIRFGKLVIMWEVPAKTEHAIKTARRYVQCMCDCGAATVSVYQCMKKGGTKSCGCHRKHTFIERNTKHGLTSKGQITPEFHIWDAMMQRCHNPNNPNYIYYGARGIHVYKPWHDFHNFYKDVGQRPSCNHQLDRVNNNKGYNPINVRWVTRKKNMRNTRRSYTWNIKGIEFDAAIEAARHYGVGIETIRGWCGLQKNRTHLKKPDCWAIKKYEPTKQF